MFKMKAYVMLDGEWVRVYPPTSFGWWVASVLMIVVTAGLVYAATH